MDLATLLGFLIAWSLIIATIALGAAASTFINTPSFMIVIGGTFAVVMMRFTLKQFIGSMKTATKAFLHKSEDPTEIITSVVQLAGIARKEGLLALERQEVQNPALALGIRMLVDGHEPAVVRKANMFALPLADKLALRSNEELMNKSIIIESVMGIQEGQNPKVLEELLKNYLPASKRDAEAPAPAEA